MRQKFSVNVADVTMNIVCEETQETIDAATNLPPPRVTPVPAPRLPCSLHWITSRAPCILRSA